MAMYMMREMLGWSASAILVMTIVRQIYRQWQQGSSKGVSKWLFIGQMAASTGFWSIAGSSKTLSFSLPMH
jgi:MtN3 and saliva related transmembrane protein